jgi:hypothetical protein
MSPTAIKTSTAAAQTELREHHGGNCAVIMACGHEVIMRLDGAEKRRFPKLKTFVQVLTFLLEYPTVTAWVLNINTVKLEPLLGFVPWVGLEAAAPEVVTTTEPEAQPIGIDDGDGEAPTEDEAAPEAEPPPAEPQAPAAPPMKRVHKPPAHIRPSVTLNEFIGSTGELTWPDVKKGWDGQFVPKASCANARVAILALKIDCWNDLFHDKLLVGGHAIDQWAGELSDHACQMLRVMIQKHFGFDPGRENVHDAAIQLCLQNPFDPVLDYLDGLTWDKKRRLDSWFINYLGADDTELNRVIGRLALIAAVRRARHPGCKFDQIIVLEGPEGTEKSTAIATMAGEENFSDQTILGLDEKRHMELIKGKWLYEIADLAGMKRSEVEAVKAFASRKTDRGRPAYGRHVVEQPRRCVLIATTNDSSYLKSQTGNRRFWPVKTGKIAIDRLRQDRDQLWAEAAQAEASNESIKLPERLWSRAAVEQNKRLEHDPWDDILEGVQGEIHRGYDGDEERVASIALISECLKIPADRQTKEVEKKVGQCMRRLGWEGPKTQRVGGILKRGYSRRISQGEPGPAENSAQKAPWHRIT